MTKDEFESETGRFVATLTTLDTTLHTEFKPDGTLVIQGFIDSVQWVKTELVTVDVDGDGVPDDVAHHWVNIRWAGFEDARVHVRCIRAVRETEGYVLMETIEDRRLEFFNLDENADSKNRIIEILRWREKNRAAYDRQSTALLDEAKGLVGHNLSN